MPAVTVQHTPSLPLMGRGARCRPRAGWGETVPHPGVASDAGPPHEGEVWSSWQVFETRSLSHKGEGMYVATERRERARGWRLTEMSPISAGDE